VTEIGSGSCPMTVFGTSGVEPSGFSATVLNKIVLVYRN
jgi:hypothetical protein